MNEKCLHCGFTIRAFGDAWVHTDSGLITCRRGKSNQHNGIYRAEPVTVESIATRMRDRCVEKVREMEAEWREQRQREKRDYMEYAAMELGAKAQAAFEISRKLQSLTLEGEQEKSKC